jgi:hypothetical protein
MGTDWAGKVQETAQGAVPASFPRRDRLNTAGSAQNFPVRPKR